MYTYNSTTKMVNAGTLDMQNTNTQVQAHTQTQRRMANQSSAHLTFNMQKFYLTVA